MKASKIENRFQTGFNSNIRFEKNRY